MKFFIFLLTFFTINLFAQEISIMSYNIGSANWNTTKDSVIGRILANDAEVVCLHEAGGPKLSYLETELTNYRLLQTFGLTPNQTATHLFIKDIVDVLDSGFVQTDTYIGYTGQDRFVNWAQLSFNNNAFFVYASHFVSTYGANADSAIIGQYRHANTMIQLMNAHATYNLPQITCGDFNADSSKAVMQFLLNQTPISYYNITIINPLELDDSWYVSNPTTNKPATVSVGTSNATIDWILVNPICNISTALIDTLGVNINSQNPSDHFPLITTLDFGFTSVNEYQNINRKLIKIVDIFGKEATAKQKGLLFYIYDDSSFEKKIIIE